jgi:hypothetical protein
VIRRLLFLKKNAMEEILARLARMESSQAEQFSSLRSQISSQAEQFSSFRSQISSQISSQAEQFSSLRSKISSQMAALEGQFVALKGQFVAPKGAAQGGQLSAVRDELQSPDGSGSTSKSYEDSGRALIMRELEPRFGLCAVPGISPHRLVGEIKDKNLKSVEWDFRIPVKVSATLPEYPLKADDFVIYPSRLAYTRPPTPPTERLLTPTKVPAAENPPGCHFVAIFEITTSRGWSKKLLSRLEERLTVSLDRARHLSKDITGILDVCAVIGVVAPEHCQQSIANKLNTMTIPLLHSMMSEGRFVWLLQAVSASVGGSTSSLTSGS